MSFGRCFRLPRFNICEGPFSKKSAPGRRCRSDDITFEIHGWCGARAHSIHHGGEVGFVAAHERLLELSAILATGIHRLRAIHSASLECTQSPADSSATGLDAGREFALMGAGLQPESEESDDGH